MLVIGSSKKVPTKVVSCPDPYDTIHRIPNVFIVEGPVLECKKTLDEQICSK